MERQENLPELLDLMTQPGFCVKESIIVQVNAAARGLQLSTGMEIGPLLLTGAEEYAAFTGGCLSLTLTLSGESRGATVVRTEQGDIFLPDPDAQEGELRALALAARELREPLSAMMATAEEIFAHAPDAQAAQLNRSLYQMLRILGNMSDAGRFSNVTHPETRNLTALMAELFEKAQGLMDQAGLTLTYQPPLEEIRCLVDAEQLERAVWNLLSNAAKFTPRGGHVDASFTRQGRMLRLTIQDSGSGIAETVRGDLFRRYLRQPAIEDRRFGLGLGLSLVRSTARHHGGTVLIDQPQGGGTRVTLTLALRQRQVLCSPRMRVDYTGERDHGLLELSERLPSSLYLPD